MHVRVDKLTSSEAPRASALLTRAFAEDPIITHFLSGRLRRTLAFPAFFRAVLAELLSCGHVYAARNDRDLLGVAAWMPPEACDPDAAARATAANQRRLVRLLFPRGARKLFAGFEALDQFHPSDPHWYLAFVGIEPDAQSSGIGATLLTPILDVADSTGTRCYLETPFARTHAFYERLGFVRLADRPFIGAPHGVVTFIRDARA